ncbi:DUF1330 domain-containing protein [Massilia antarctica]|uniref:DUF1330 domain-containing protein n=1 Tax=Massilia antarctica TaxID=2765360 RepID=A0AA49AAT1_9BURK|nr:DUF1330 domain-containing protein [Massilia antarctica]QPI52546.1 DUF1330 domain-containing protein [Massilia antarctica]
MAAYAIGSLTVHTTQWQQEYGAKMPALIHKHGGKVLAKAAAQGLEGQSLLPGTVVMIEFPTAQQALAWNEDPEHAPLRRLRQGGASFDLMLVDGL